MWKSGRLNGVGVETICLRPRAHAVFFPEDTAHWFYLPLEWWGSKLAQTQFFGFKLASGELRIYEQTLCTVYCKYGHRRELPIGIQMFTSIYILRNRIKLVIKRPACKASI